MSELLDKLKELEDNNVRCSNIEEWVNEFMEGIAEKMSDISTMNWVNKIAIGALLGVPEDVKAYNDQTTPSMKLARELNSEYHDKDTLKKEYQKAKDLEEFFSELSI